MFIEHPDKLIRFLNTKWGQVECPICKKISWNVPGTIYELREFNNGNLIIGGNSSLVPVIPITCNNCGNVIFINAITAGLVQNNGRKNDGK